MCHTKDPRKPIKLPARFPPPQRKHSAVRSLQAFKNGPNAGGGTSAAAAAVAGLGPH